ncbi:TrfB-related DNA-binding protein [Pseudomonas sp. LPH60]|uniref:TrfB-related DNA-binding protein n=1 Tax=Pseudomonas sp. LPH60 TaxID=3065906 RepID=UPI00273B3509|nr:TrfB-related DNA-binding protein [Pseudomonas sp. LPH60]MDP4573470.1 TrfB-related DNA-binding protein [Pseudomonas sp. LPH60]
MTKPLRMSPEEFEREQSKLVKLSVQVNTLARLMFVDGKTLQEASAALNMSKQNAYKHMKRVNALLKDVPATWVQVNELMPPWLATWLYAKLDEEKDNLKNNSKPSKPMVDTVYRRE